VIGISISGANADNYILGSTTAVTRANITPPSNMNPQLENAINNPNMNNGLIVYVEKVNPGQAFFYQPLTLIDISAFDEMTLNASDYEFINNSLSLIGHHGLLRMWMLEDLNNRQT
jgi:hypothetical protein